MNIAISLIEQHVNTIIIITVMNREECFSFERCIQKTGSWKKVDEGNTWWSVIKAYNITLLHEELVFFTTGVCAG